RQSRRSRQAHARPSPGRQGRGSLDDELRAVAYRVGPARERPARLIRRGAGAQPSPSARNSCAINPVDVVVAREIRGSKNIGLLSFGAWHPGGGLTHTARDALQQTVELAVAAEEIGIDGAFVRVHHFARQLASPFPLLAAIGVRTSRIEIGTGVIDMR